MSFSDHKITKFTHPVSELPDQPSLPPKDLKARFDSSPEELRQAVNGICDDAARLDERVFGIVAQTFGDSIDKSMLSSELQSEIEEKASQAALAAEAIAREALSRNVAQKCEAYFGTYTGDGTADRIIELGFRPIAAIILCNNSFYALKTKTLTCVQYTDVSTSSNATAETGLHVGSSEYDGRYKSEHTNVNGRLYEYIAFKGA